MTAAHRSAHPNIPGVPWWGAVLIAVTLTAAGFAFDAGSGNKELSTAFAAFYVIGCVAAVLAVRQAAIFTAVVQPPLILFFVVPGAYFLFNHSEIHGVKDILINCGYPLIERFLLMFSTAVAVLLIGMARWYFGAASRSRKATSEATTAEAEPAGAGRATGLTAKMSGLFGGGAVDTEDAGGELGSSRKHAIDRPATAEKPSRSRRPAARPAPTRSRHVRPPLEDLTEEEPEGPRRRRPPRDDRDPRDIEADHPAAERRRPRAPREQSQRARAAREPREPRDYRREARERREARDPYPDYERPARPRRQEPYDPAASAEPYPPFDSYEPPRRRPPANGNHHPVSKVRYRGNPADEGDNHVEYRTDPRRARHRRPEAWEYDA